MRELACPGTQGDGPRSTTRPPKVLLLGLPWKGVTGRGNRKPYLAGMSGLADGSFSRAR